MRLPDDLRLTLQRIAKKDDRSFNKVIVMLLAEAVSQRGQVAA